ncbi:zinc finger protein 28-like [Physella acuta]|uniref:zinc finger protein 28-like n=1 Tax=Physella acuta TaxID=109671 RepID=UPI0027DD409A|nr:zinc finger protein 28-like [Physella acuta]
MNENLQCTVCSRRCYNSKKLTKHFRKQHPEVELIKCCFCDHATPESLFAQHKQDYHPLERFACKFCKFTSRKWRSLKKHHTSHVTPEIKSSSNFYSVEILNCKISSRISEESSLNQTSKISLPEHAFGNTEAQSSIKNKEENLLVVEGIPKEHIGTSENKIINTVKQDTQVTGPLPQTSRELKCSCEGLKHCKICQQTNPNRQTTTQPLAEWFKCEDCQKSFEYSLHLTYHRLVHKLQRCYICGKCDRYFNEPEDFDQHLLKHFKHKPFKCEMCEKAFTLKCHLKVHMRLHTRNLVYKCNLCNYATNLMSGILDHKRVHMNIKPYK